MAGILGDGTGGVLEHAVLHVVPGKEDEFEAVLAEALPVVAGSPGCRRARVARCIETPGRFLLLIEWDSVEAHTEGFRSSPAYEEWRRLVHHFWDPRPTVEHFTVVARA
jgi:heme-degrading monooxygenase HmoA